MYTHASDNRADRKIGEYWERRFCQWAAKFEKSFTPMQIGRPESAQAFDKSNSYTLPDVTIWTSPGEHHEIKHKCPVKGAGWYGLEEYRLNALLWFAKETKQDVLYTIHNHELSGGRNSKIDKLEHWFTVDILELPGNIAHKKSGQSYVNGQAAQGLNIFYWRKELWIPLSDFWNSERPKIIKQTDDKITLPLLAALDYLYERNLTIARLWTEQPDNGPPQTHITTKPISKK
jgi:hypothetical protein